MANRSQHGRVTIYVERKKLGHGENYCLGVGKHDQVAAGRPLAKSMLCKHDQVAAGPPLAKSMFSEHDQVAAGRPLAKSMFCTVPTPPAWASAVNSAKCGRTALSLFAPEKPSPEDFLTSSGRPRPSFENKKDKDGNNSDGDDHNPGGNGANNRKESRDRGGPGNKDTDKQSHDDGRGYKGQSLGFMAGFGNGCAYHSGYENEYPVGQLKCAEKVPSPTQLICDQQVSAKKVPSLQQQFRSLQRQEVPSVHQQFRSLQRQEVPSLHQQFRSLQRQEVPSLHQQFPSLQRQEIPSLHQQFLSVQ